MASVFHVLLLPQIFVHFIKKTFVDGKEQKLPLGKHLIWLLNDNSWQHFRVYREFYLSFWEII
jgi:hypothetical protein